MTTPTFTDESVELFRHLAVKTRRLIIVCLSEQSLTQVRLQRRLASMGDKVSQPLMHYHLDHLLFAGLVMRLPSGSYQLKPQTMLAAGGELQRVAVLGGAVEK